jgi:hypothetical protein
MNEIKKIPRAPMRPEKEPGVEIELWQPDWKCFCCHDSGMIVPHLAALIIDGYDSNRDKFPLCVNPGCKAASKYDSEFWDASVDRRIEPANCQQLDLLERESWERTVQAQSKRIQETTSALSKEKSLRVPCRTANEDQATLDKHRLVVEEDWGLVAQTSAEKRWLAEWEGEG